MNLFLSPPSFLFLFPFLPFFVTFLLLPHLVLNSSPTSLFFLISLYAPLLSFFYIGYTFLSFFSFFSRALLNPYLAHHLTLYQML